MLSIIALPDARAAMLTARVVAAHLRVAAVADPAAVRACADRLKVGVEHTARVR